MSSTPWFGRLAAASVVTALAAAVSGVGCESERYYRGNLRTTVNDSEATSLTTSPPDWAGDAELCRVGPYTMIGPADGHQGILWTFRNDKMISMFDDTLGASLVHDGRPVVSLYDEDRDGKIDRISYSIHHDGFRDWLSIVDSNFDGQPDMRIRSRKDGDRTVELWISDRWYEGMASGGGVLVDGVRQEIAWTSEGWKFE